MVEREAPKDGELANKKHRDKRVNKEKFFVQEEMYFIVTVHLIMRIKRDTQFFVYLPQGWYQDFAGFDLTPSFACDIFLEFLSHSFEEVF